jgi:transcriptional regulator with XRE-family HTH domain
VSDAARNPTAVRRELGQRLRALRQGTELTVVQAAGQIGISPSKVTKIELAQLAATRDDVLKMLEAYGETDTEQQELLLSMMREGKRKHWWADIDQARLSAFLRTDPHNS